MSPRVERCIAVLIPVYGRLDALRSSIASLADAPPGTSIVIVDDGNRPSLNPADVSSPHTLHIIRNEVNSGIVKSLNRGLAYISESGYEFIARLDAGDHCVNGRLVRQLGYMRQHPDCMLLGAYVDYFDEKGDLVSRLRPPSHPAVLTRAVYSKMCFVHPVVMFRTRVLERTGVYSQSFPGCEDMDLFLRIARCFETGIVPEVLLHYEVTANSISQKNYRSMQWNRLRVQLARQNWLFLESYLGIAKTLFCLLASRRGALRAKTLFDRSAALLFPYRPTLDGKSS